MERKQGFFSTLKQEVVRGLSPGRSRARCESPMSRLRRRSKKQNQVLHPDLLIGRSGNLRPVETLSPLKEGPDPEGSDCGDSRVDGGWGHWMKGQLSRAPSVSSSAYKGSDDLRLLLGVMGAPLAPVHVSFTDPLPHLSIKNTPIVSISYLSLLIAKFSSYFLHLSVHVSCLLS